MNVIVARIPFSVTFSLSSQARFLPTVNPLKRLPPEVLSNSNTFSSYLTVTARPAIPVFSERLILTDISSPGRAVLLSIEMTGIPTAYAGIIPTDDIIISRDNKQAIIFFIA